MGSQAVGDAVGNHWVLLAGLGVLGLALWDATRRILAAIDERIHTNLTLWAGNGGGQKIKTLVAEGVAAGLERHRFECPLRVELEELEDRLRALEDKR